MNKELFVTVAIITAITALLLIGGCAQQPQQKPETQAPQQQPPQTQPEKQPEQAATLPELPQQPTPASETEAAQHDLLGKPKSAAADWAQSQQRLGGQSKTEEDDLYKDNLGGAIDDLSQLEQ